MDPDAIETTLSCRFAISLNVPYLRRVSHCDRTLPAVTGTNATMSKAVLIPQIDAEFGWVVVPKWNQPACDESDHRIHNHRPHFPNRGDS
jgi:hypothetical protein